jgi:uncharacterized protein
MKTERRFLTTEMRAAESDAEQMIIEGYAIVYEQETDLGFFREKIARGAATNALKRSDEFMLFNHDSNKPLARRKNDTLEAIEDDKGVFIRADVSKSSNGEGVYRDVKSGLIDKMSFAFTVEAETWEERQGEKELRIVTEFDQLFDYSAVTYPAYEQTQLMARSAESVLHDHRSSTEKTETSAEVDDEAYLEELEMYVRELQLLELGAVRADAKKS